MKNTVAPVALIVLLLSAMPVAAPALAEEAVVKVDPTKIPKLTKENAPQPSLAEKLAAPFKGSNKKDALFVDPSKTPLPKPPVPVGDLAEIPDPDAKPKPFVPEPPKIAESGEASGLGKPPVVAPKPDLKPSKVEAPRPETPMPKIEKLKDEKAATKVPAPVPGSKDKKPEKAPEKAKDAAPEVTASAPPEAAEKPAEEKSGLSKYLPW